MYAVGNGLTLLKSGDDGATWEAKPVLDVPGGDLTSIRNGRTRCRPRDDRGRQPAAAHHRRRRYVASIVPSSDASFGVVFVTPSRAVTVGAFGSAQVSDDAGANWQTVGSRIQGPFTVLHAVSSVTAFAGGSQGVLARTVDGGQTWANISPPTSAAIVGIAAPTPTTLFVLASDGSLQRSDNSGVSYRILNTGTTRAISAVVALDTQTILLIGPRGLLRSTNSGEEFKAVAGKMDKARSFAQARS